MAQYFYYDGTERKGPFSSQQVRALAGEGIIRPETLLESDKGHRFSAAKIDGLQFGDPTDSSNQNIIPPPFLNETFPSDVFPEEELPPFQTLPAACKLISDNWCDPPSYYFYEDSVKVGPVNITQLSALANVGVIEKSTIVEDKDGKRDRAYAINGLFPSNGPDKLLDKEREELRKNILSPYYYVDTTNGKWAGPVSVETFRDLIEEGEIYYDTIIAGMGKKATVADVLKPPTSPVTQLNNTNTQQKPSLELFSDLLYVTGCRIKTSSYVLGIITLIGAFIALLSMAIEIAIILVIGGFYTIFLGNIIKYLTGWLSGVGYKLIEINSNLAGFDSRDDHRYK